VGLAQIFRLQAFLQYAFDTSVCLLEAFRHGNPEEFASMLAKQTAEFTNEQLRHTTPLRCIYAPRYDPTVASAFSWHQEFPLTVMEGAPRGAEEIMKDTPMNPHALPRVHHHRDRTRVVKPKKRGFCARLCGKKPRPQHLAEAHKDDDDRLEAEIRLNKSQTKNELVAEEITRWQEEVTDLKTLLQHRLQVGHDLNLPVDDVLAKAMNKTEDLDDSKTRRAAPEFTSFEEARQIVLHATA